MDVLRTVEARWFFRGPLPAAARAWFDGLGPGVGRESRTDRYLAPASDALGVKLREGAVEAKRRTGRAGPLAGAEAEAWTKWSFPLAGAESSGDDLPKPDGGWVEVAKTRGRRSLGVGDGGCALELAEVEVGGNVWWSVCLEAAGRDDAARRAAIEAGHRRWLTVEGTPDLPADAAMGYPAWLRSLEAEADAAAP